MPNNHLVLTKSQQHAFLEFNNFLEKDGRVFILKGYAGTGKTTLMQEFIKELEKRDYKFVLLASTGRAAKILGDITERESCTVHSHIYKFIDFNQDLDEVQRKQKKEEDSGQLLLDFALADINNDTTQRKRFYFVDESSMIADVEDKMPTQAKFGSGRLLKDLLKYDEDGHFIFIGDECQLPPINQSISCALSTDYFKDEYHIEAKEASLTEIVKMLRLSSTLEKSEFTVSVDPHDGADVVVQHVVAGRREDRHDRKIKKTLISEQIGLT